MTTPTPTSNLVPAPVPLPHAEQVPPFDVNALQQLANAFFTAAPSASQAASPKSAAPVAAFGSPHALELPATPPLVPPDSAIAASPPLTPLRFSPTLSAGAAPLASELSYIVPGLPQVPRLDQAGYPPAHAGGGFPAPSAPGDGANGQLPYYFLGETAGYPTSDVEPDFSSVLYTRAQAASTSPDPQSFGVPGAGELEALLNQPLTTETPAAPVSGQRFYFVPETGVAAPPAAAPEAGTGGAFDVNFIRRDFPILQERVNGKPLIWFDNAATTQKPRSVIERLTYFYEHENSNIHRAAHELAARATDAYEGARNKVAKFIGASSDEEIIFVRGATEGVNLVAQSWGRANIKERDEIIVSHLEHHANIVPWQQLAREKGAIIRVIPVDDSGQVLLEEYQRLLNSRTKLVAVTQVSNALGTVVPVAEIVAMAHRAGARALVDGAQSVSHLRVNVQALDADFFIFSGHKIFGPTGIGVVYGKRAILEDMPPWQGGGNMIANVTFERTIYQPPPSRFEAGTGNIADAVGLGAALDYVERVGIENIAAYEHGLLEYATHGLKTIPGLRLIGTALEKASVASFVLAGYKPEEVGKALNQEGIAVRAGHHCAQPILRRFGVEATVRPSLAFYNTCAEIDCMIAVLRRLAGRGAH